MSDLALRFLNGIRKIAAGLSPFSESVWPGVRNDLFVAHESIYAFAKQYAHDENVLDAGCGTGYGAHLLGSVAKSVTAVDIDRRSIAFARTHYAAPDIRFEVGDLESLAYPDASFGFVIASNALEHLSHPDAFLRRVQRMLRRGGKALVAVPPISGEHDLHLHSDIHYHRSNLHLDAWQQLFAGCGFRASVVRHWADPLPDFHSRRASKLAVENFTFTPVDAFREPTISGMFVLTAACS